MSFWDTLRANKAKAVAEGQAESAISAVSTGDTENLSRTKAMAASTFAKSQSVRGVALKKMNQIEHLQDI